MPRDWIGLDRRIWGPARGFRPSIRKIRKYALTWVLNGLYLQCQKRETKMARKAIKHEITLWAFGREGRSATVLDIVETNRHNAYRFARGFMRNPDVHAIAAVPPGVEPDATYMYALPRETAI